jgi:hypothetical protein
MNQDFTYRGIYAIYTLIGDGNGGDNGSNNIKLTYNVMTSTLLCNYNMSESFEVSISNLFYKRFNITVELIQLLRIPIVTLNAMQVYIINCLQNLLDTTNVTALYISTVLQKIGIDRNYDDIVSALKLRFIKDNTPQYMNESGNIVLLTPNVGIDNKLNQYMVKITQTSRDELSYDDLSVDQLLSKFNIDEYPILLINNITNAIKYRLVDTSNNIYLLSSDDVNSNLTLKAFASIGQTTFYLPKNKQWPQYIIKTWLSNSPYDYLMHITKPVLDDWKSLLILIDYMDNKGEMEQLVKRLLTSGKYLIVDMLPNYLRSKVFLYATWFQVPDDLKSNLEFFKLWKQYHSQSHDIKFVSPYI